MHMYNFELPNVVDGGIVSLEDFNSQKGIVVIFSCNHCPYAIAYELRLIELHNRFATNSIPVVVISSNDVIKYPQDGPNLMRERALQRGFPFPYLWDENQSIARGFGAQRTPEAFLLKNEGNGNWSLVYTGAIDNNWQDARAVTQHYLADAAQQLLADESIEHGKTAAVGCSIKWA